MFGTDNPLADYDRHMREQQRQIDKLPKCYECGESITGELCYEFNDEYICSESLRNNHRKWVEDIVE